MPLRYLLLLTCAGFSALAQTNSLGQFTRSADIGNPAVPGSALFANGTYRITGAGANIWGKSDQFQYVWRGISGDFSLTATLHFVGSGVEHRKAGVMVRQSLDPDAAYADVLVHGSGMPALQWRSRKGEDTNTFDFPTETPGPVQIKLVRTGVKIYLYLARPGGELKRIANTEVGLQNPVLVGLVVCSHLPEAATTAVFSDVSIQQQQQQVP